MDVILGCDPGTNTAIAAIGTRGEVLGAAHVQFKTSDRIIQRTQHLNKWLETAIERDWQVVWVMVEDVTTGGYMRNSQHSTAILNQIYGATVQALMRRTPVIEAVAPQTWMPRERGARKTLEQTRTIAYLRQCAGDKAHILSNEHKTMAYGLARHGLGRYNLHLSRIRAGLPSPAESMGGA